MSTFLKYRSREEELMDDLSSGGPVIDQTLKELEIINRLLGGNHVTINGLKKLSAGRKELSVIDLGCGGGDMLKLICDWGRRNNISLQVTGIDANPNIIEYAKQHTADYQEIDYLTMDIFSEQFTDLSCDIFTSTLFMHHLENEELVNILHKMRHQARLGIVINDLHRHWFAYYSIKYLTQLFSRSAMVKNDAAVSVQRSFLKRELASLMFEATIRDFELKWFWAFRWQVIARTNS